MWFADLETDGFVDVVTTVWCGVFIEHKTGEKRVFGPDDNTIMLDFMDSIDHLVLHNGIGFDMKVLKKLFNYDYPGKLDDSLVLSKLLKPNRTLPKKMPPEARKSGPHSIAAWGYRVGRGKPEHNDWTQFSEEMLYRCEEDVEILALAWEKMQDEMKHGSWKRAVPMTMKLFTILQKSEDYGWLVDQEHMHKSLNMLEHWINKIDSILIQAVPMIRIIEDSKITGKEEWRHVSRPFTKAGRYTSHVDDWLFKIARDTHHYIDMVYDRYVVGPFCRVEFRKTNLNSNKETKDFLLEAGWQPVEWNIDDEGNETSPKLSKNDPFDGISGGAGRLAARRVQCRHRQSTILGWFKVIREDGRISQRVTGLAVTGRAKHQRIVNVPNGEAFFGKWMRQVFTVPDDKVLLGTDADSCQNRMLASRVGDENFTNIILHGTKKDKTTIHYVNQKLLAEAGYDVSYGMTKNIGYAFNFGASDNKLGKMVKGSKADGTRVREALLSVSAGLEDLLKSILDEWQSNALRRYNKKWNRWEYFNGWIEGLDKRPIYINSSHALLVYLLQSDEAITMEYGYLYLYDWLTKEGLVWGDDWAYVAWNHDEWQIECKPEHVELITKLSNKAINKAGNTLKLAIEQIGDTDTGRTWYDTH